MTRKRAVKLLMARGHSRNCANALMCHKDADESNFLAFSNYCAWGRVYDSIGRASDAFRRYAVSMIALEMKCLGQYSPPVGVQCEKEVADNE